MESKLQQECGKMVIRSRDLMTDNLEGYSTPTYRNFVGFSIVAYYSIWRDTRLEVSLRTPTLMFRF